MRVVAKVVITNVLMDVGQIVHQHVLQKHHTNLTLVGIPVNRLVTKVV